MTRTVAVGGIIAATLLIAISYVAVLVTGGTPSWAPWAYMLGTVTVMLATTVLGAARRAGGVGRLATPFAFIYALLLMGFGAALALPPEAAGATLWLGLPRRAAIVLYGIGILPLFLLPIAYARTFDAMTLREDDLALVAKAKQAREAREARAPGVAARAGEAA
jgi:hypothetical protein